MSNTLAHFAIEADDVERARRFYANVFGWTFETWGPPDFYLIKGAGIHGALQTRTRPKADGSGGFELSFAVPDLGHTTTVIKDNGGAVPDAPYTIPGVGTLVYFYDSEGNRAIAIEYSNG